MRAGDPPRTQWTFPAPVGTRPVIGEFTMADSATIPTHLDVPETSTYMSRNAVDDLLAPEPTAPVAVDARGRSAQTFLIDVVARAGGTERRAVARGRDICAVTAPLASDGAGRRTAAVPPPAAGARRPAKRSLVG